MRIFGAWARTDDTESSWIAVAEIYEGGPVVLMVASRLADGSWRGLMGCRDEAGSWGPSPELAGEKCATRSAAQHWCEETAAGLAGGRS